MSDGDFQRIQELAEYYMPEKIKQVLRKADEFLAEKKRTAMTGIEKIAQERLEQKVKHNRTIRSDYQLNPDFQLRDAAVGLLLRDIPHMPPDWNPDVVAKMLLKSYEERLVIAGALIAAEIDRLNFKE